MCEWQSHEIQTLFGLHTWIFGFPKDHEEELEHYESLTSNELKIAFPSEQHEHIQYRRYQY